MDLGQVRFEIDPNTSSLSRARREVNEFTDAVANAEARLASFRREQSAAVVANEKARRASQQTAKASADAAAAKERERAATARANKAEVDLAAAKRRLAEAEKRYAQQAARSTEQTKRSRMATERASAALERHRRSMDRVNQSASSTTRVLGRLQGALALVGGTMAFREVARWSDAWQGAANQLRQVTSGTAELADMQNRLMQVADDSRSSYESTARLYARLTRSTKELNLSTQETLDLVETLNKGFATNGATAQEASAAITQLTQGLAAGALRGQEYNSVAEQAPAITRAIASSVNMTIGELRAFAAEGGLTAEIVVNAMQQSSEAIANNFDKTVFTFSQQIAVAENHIIRFVGESQILQDSINAIGKGLMQLTRFMSAHNQQITTTISVLGGAALAYGTLRGSIMAAQKAQLLLNAAVRANPYVMLVSAIGAVVGSLYAARDATITLSDTTTTVGTAVSGMWYMTTSAIADAWNEIIGPITAGIEAIASRFTDTSESTTSVWEKAMNGVLNVAKWAVNTVIGVFYGFALVVEQIIHNIADNFTTLWTGLVDGAQATGRGIIAGLTGNFDEAQQHFSAAGEALNRELKSPLEGVINVAKEAIMRDYMGELFGSIEQYAAAKEMFKPLHDWLFEVNKTTEKASSSTSELTKEQKKLQKEFKKTAASFREDIFMLEKQMEALDKASTLDERKKALEEVSDMVKLRYELEHGELANLSEAKKQQLIAYQREKSALEDAKEEAEDYNDKVSNLIDEHDDHAQTIAKLRKQIELTNKAYKDPSIQMSLQQRERIIGSIRDRMEELNLEADPIAKAVADSWEEAGKRIDETFADAFKGAFDSFGDFKDQLLDGFKRLLAELAYQATLKPIIVNFTGQMQGMMGGGGAGGGLSGLLGGGGSGGFGGLSSIITKGAGMLNSGAQALGNAWRAFQGVGSTYGGQFGASLGASAGGGLGAANASLANSSFGGLASMGAGMAGNALGGAVFGGGKTSSDLGTIGGAIGSIWGPLGSAIGSFLGQGVGSLFGDKYSGEDPTGLIATRNQFGNAGRSGWERDAMATGAFGDVGFAPDSRDIDTLFGDRDNFENAKKYAEQLAETDNLVAQVARSEEDLNAMRKAAAKQGLVDIADIESRYDTVFEALDGQYGEFVRSLDGSMEEIVAKAQNAHQAFTVLSDAAGMLNLRFDATSDSAYEAAASVAEMVGGVSNLNSLQSQYYDTFISNEEKRANLIEDLNTQFGEMSMVLPESIEGFRDLVEGVNIHTKNGRENYAQLMRLVPAMKQYLDGMDDQEAALQRAAEIADQRAALEIELLRAYGREGEAVRRERQAELDEMDASLRPMQERVWAMQDAAEAEREATRAAEQHAQAMARAQDTMRGFVTSIEGWLDEFRATQGTPSENLAVSQAALREQLQAAQGGDRNALGSITQYADRLISAAQGQFASGDQAQSIIGDVLKSLEELPEQLSPEQFLAQEIGGSISDASSALLAALSGLSDVVAHNFGNMDSNLDGLLTFSELQRGLSGIATDQQIQSLMALMDANNDGQISKLEALLASVNDGSAKYISTLRDEMESLGKAQLTESEVRDALHGKASDAEIGRLIDRLDMNADGIISAEELTASRLVGMEARIASALAPSFETLDTSVDGVLSFEELKDGLKGLATNREIRSMINAIDANGDGVVSKIEALIASNASSDALMTNRLNNQLQELGAEQLTAEQVHDALAGKATKAQITRLINRADKNSDGILTAQEITAARVQQLAPAIADSLSGSFQMLDKNMDEKLTFDELKQGLAGIATDAQLISMMDLMDMNSDKVISSLESVVISEMPHDARLATVLRNQLNATRNSQLTKRQVKDALSPIATDAEIDRLINRLDANGDGIISAEEATAARIVGLTKGISSAITDSFRSLDVSVDGLLTFDELKQGLDGIATDDELRNLIAMTDRNGDSVISQIEAAMNKGTSDNSLLMNLVSNQMKANRNQIKWTRNQLKDSLAGKASNAIINRLINRSDKNNDGVISATEAAAEREVTELSKQLQNQGKWNRQKETWTVNRLERELQGKASSAVIKRLINRVDKNGDGIISAEERAAETQTTQLSDVLVNQGKWTRNQLKWTRNQIKDGLQGKASNAAVHRLINRLDQNSDGIITATEGSSEREVTALSKVMQEEFAETIKSQELTTDRLQSELQGRASTAIIRRLINRVDQNGDGVISATEMSAEKEITKLSDVLAKQGKWTRNRINWAGNKQITVSDLRDQLSGKATKAQITRLINRLDQNGDGIITKQEFTNAKLDMLGEDIGRVLGPMFDAIDENTSGLVSITEFKQAFEGMASDSELQRIFNKLDRNNDGQISKLEAIEGNTGQTSGNTGESALSLQALANQLQGQGLAVSLAKDHSDMGMHRIGQALSERIWWRFRNYYGWSQGVPVSLSDTHSGSGTTDIAKIIGKHMPQVKSEPAYAVSSDQRYKFNKYLMTYAKGGAFNNGMEAFADGGAFTNSIVNKPTTFDMGLMGEAGPEAIMPLSRTPSGELGVQTVQGNEPPSYAVAESTRAIYSVREELRMTRIELREALEEVDSRVGQGNEDRRAVAAHAARQREDQLDETQSNTRAVRNRQRKGTNQ